MGGFITYTTNQLTQWQDRWVNGPWKTTGTEFAYSPGSGDDCQTLADNVVSISPVTDAPYYRDTSLETDPGANFNATDAICVAFVYLVTGNSTYGNWAKDYLLSQIRESVADWSTYSNAFGLDATLWFSGPWWVRLFHMYDYTYDLYSGAEITELDAWFQEGAEWHKDANQNRFVLQFPNRTSESYNEPGDRLSVAANESMWGGQSGQEPWTHEFPDPIDGDRKNPMPNIATWYTNANSMSMVPCALWGAYKNDATLKLHARIFTEEVIKYHCFPDGTWTEYKRNGNNNRQSQGAAFYGGGIMIGAMVYSAQMFEKYGDTALWDYSTLEGIAGTEVGGVNGSGKGIKSIRTLLDTVYENHAQTVIRHSTIPADPSGRTILDSFDGGTYMFTPEQELAIANQKYDLQVWKDAYNNDVGYAYFSGMSNPTYNQLKWGGTLGMFPALPLMYYGLENIDISGNAQGSKSLLI